MLFLQGGFVKKRGERLAEGDKFVHAERFGSSLRVYGTALHGLQNALNVPGWKRTSQGVEEGFPSMSKGRSHHLPKEFLMFCPSGIGL